MNEHTTVSAKQLCTLVFLSLAVDMASSRVLSSEPFSVIMAFPSVIAELTVG